MSSEPVRMLILLRHGKSAYPPGVADHGRPLAERGRRQAALAGRRIRATVGGVDLVLCSTAERTRQTLVAADLAAGAEVRYLDEIYGAESDEILDVIVDIAPTVRKLLVVGHFPGVADLAEDLAGPGTDRGALADLKIKFPTSAFAVVAVAGSWSDLPAGGRLTAFTVPREPSQAEETR